MFKIARGLLLAGLAVASTSACASFHAEALPPSDFADTEASTNVCLDVTQVLSAGDGCDVLAAVEYGADRCTGRGCVQ